jgi:kynurenine formamidase
VLFDAFDIIDLTQPLSESSPSWNGSCGFRAEIKKDYNQMFRVQQIKMHAGIGTHMDAPSHRFEGAASIGDLPISSFFSPLCLIDVSTKAHADYEIPAEEITLYEKTYGFIPQGALVIGYTGWSRFWADGFLYRGIDSKGQMHFPAFSAKAASLLLQRQVVGLGIDSLSPDCQDLSYPVHELFLGANKYIIENIADCSKVPSKGAYAICLPLHAKHCTESPIRIAALVPRSSR